MTTDIASNKNIGIAAKAYSVYAIYCAVTGIPFVIALFFVGLKYLVIPSWAIAAGCSSLLTGILIELFLQKTHKLPELSELSLLRKLSLLMFSAMFFVIFIAGVDVASDGENTNEQFHRAMLTLINFAAWVFIFVFPVIYWILSATLLISTRNKTLANTID